MEKNVSPSDFVKNTLDESDLGWLGPKYSGKVRDVYDCKDRLALIATDRQSAFDISWCSIPLKGQVLNQISAWWFRQTATTTRNHFIDSPDPNVSVTKKLKMFAVEVVVRAYLTGTTETSIWVNYDRGVRNFCGNPLPDGMVKNQALPTTIITPTTKGKTDEPIDSQGVISRGLATADQWKEISDSALRLFKKGQEIAKQRGLILVDTKYEFGLDADGEITVGDEVHTPDSSRYWIADTYASRHKAGEEPESLDKEFFRKWLVSEGFNPKEGHSSKRPEISDSIRSMLAGKYIELFERVTGEKFVYPSSEPVLERIGRNLKKYFS